MKNIKKSIVDIEHWNLYVISHTKDRKMELVCKNTSNVITERTRQQHIFEKKY